MESTIYLIKSSNRIGVAVKCLLAAPQCYQGHFWMVDMLR
jgi:hypothetical protein